MQHPARRRPSPSGPAESGRPGGRDRADGRRRSLREQLAAAQVSAAALLPVRLFFGITFVYAGLDKLLDPSFFDAASPLSIQSQLAAFARVSPLAPLVRIGEPWAVPIGLGIAILEVGIGLGALSGIAYRLAALGGAALSLLFWLTASWATHPYYYGPDLPYAAGWLVLALAGHGDLLVPSGILARIDAAAQGDDGRAGPSTGDGWGRAPGGGWSRIVPAVATADDVLASPTRRALLQVGVVAAAALAVGSLTVPLRLLRGPGSTGSSDGVAGGPAASSDPGAVATQPPAASPTPVASGAGGGLAVASEAAVSAAGAVAFTVPFDAPAPLPAGDPALIVKLPDGSFAAYDAVCTHEGCTVEWDAADGVILCPCHGAAFDPARQARVLAGPTRQPLAALPITVDKATGTIYLQG